MKNFTSAEWIGLMVSLIAMGIGITSFSYSTFVIKDVYKDDKIDIIRRLERIETKVDAIHEARR